MLRFWDRVYHLAKRKRFQYDLIVYNLLRWENLDELFNDPQYCEEQAENELQDSYVWSGDFYARADS
jgi:hypothetical protein